MELRAKDTRFWKTREAEEENSFWTGEKEIKWNLQQDICNSSSLLLTKKKARIKIKKIKKGQNKINKWINQWSSVTAMIKILQTYIWIIWKKPQRKQKQNNPKKHRKVRRQIGMKAISPLKIKHPCMKSYINLIKFLNIVSWLTSQLSRPIVSSNLIWYSTLLTFKHVQLSRLYTNHSTIRVHCRGILFTNIIPNIIIKRVESSSFVPHTPRLVSDYLENSKYALNAVLQICGRLNFQSKFKQAFKI